MRIPRGLAPITYENVIGRELMVKRSVFPNHDTSTPTVQGWKGVVRQKRESKVRGTKQVQFEFKLFGFWFPLSHQDVVPLT